MLGWAFRIGIFKDTHFIIEKQIIYKKNMRGIDKKKKQKKTVRNGFHSTQNAM